METTPSRMISINKPRQVWTTTFYMGKFGSASPKRHKVWSNDGGLLEVIFQRGGYMSREQQTACSTKLVRKYIDKKGVRRCVGLKDELQNSQRLGFTYVKSLEFSICFPTPQTYIGLVTQTSGKLKKLKRASGTYPDLHHFCGNYV